MTRTGNERRVKIGIKRKNIYLPKYFMCNLSFYLNNYLQQFTIICQVSNLICVLTSPQLAVNCLKNNLNNVVLSILCHISRCAVNGNSVRYFNDTEHFQGLDFPRSLKLQVCTLLLVSHFSSSPISR